MRRAIVVLSVLLAAACSRPSDLLGIEASRAKLNQHRKAYEWLAAEVRACGLSHLKATGQAMDRCTGEADKARLQTAMQTLGVRSAGRRDSEVWLITGTDGTDAGLMDLSVASYMIQTDAIDPDRANPLTEAPHRWFYAQHD